MRPITRLILLLGILLSGCTRRGTDSAADGSGKTPGPRPHIIFVMVDTFRADRMGCYGNSDGLTPFMDRLATTGVRFERAISQSPWTQPSIASIHSSTYPTTHQVLDFKHALLSSLKKTPMSHVFDESFVTLAECLQQAGYHTAAVTANPFTVREYGFAQGFDFYDDTVTSTTVPGYKVTEAAIQHLATRPADKPLFLYLHYMDVHGPFTAPERFLNPLLDKVERLEDKTPISEIGFNKLDYLRTLPKKYKTKPERHFALNRFVEYWAARYDAGVWYMDAVLDGLSRKLDELGLWQDSLVILTADHGEELYDHQGWEHGFNVYQHQLHVPLILRWPGHLSADRTIQTMVQSIDIMPSLLDMLGIEPPEAIQGRSFRPLFEQDRPDGASMAFAEGVKFGNEQRTVLVDMLKLIRTPATGNIELFDLAADPREKNPLPNDDSRRADLIETLDEWLAANQSIAAKPRAVPISPQQQKRLKNIGYAK